MIIRAIKLDDEGNPTSESIDLEVESVKPTLDSFAMVASPVRVTQIADFPSSVTFLVEEDFLLIERAIDETPHSD